MAPITVTHQTGSAFSVQTRTHHWYVDQPDPAGTEQGPTPVELFVAALAGCAAHYAVGYLLDQRLPHEGLQVRCRWSMRTAPARVAKVSFVVHPPVELAEQHRAGLLAAIDQCTVASSLRQPPELTAELGSALAGAVHELAAEPGDRR